MLAQEIIRCKRDGHSLQRDQIDAFVRGLVEGSWSEGQAAAMAMAMFLRGMTSRETVDLTQAMTRSGVVLDWASADLSGPVLDKHSTGGVGDKVSLMLAPIVAACGGFVPMISGRGLGHTGGTLDKLDSIPGYQSTPDTQRLRQALQSAGCAIIGQTAELAPADRRLYAIRDVTATVESVALITASILSKKLAAGLQGLVMDVKVGNGAFAASERMAIELAQSLVTVANGAGLPTRAWITDMNQVLGDSCGNAVEMSEAVEFLQGKRREPRLLEVTRVLSADLLLIGGLALDQAQALRQVDTALDSGAALERFARMVAALGGPTDLLERPDAYLPLPEVTLAVHPSRAGFVVAEDARAIGIAIIGLGGGRVRADQPIDHAVGFTQVAPMGAAVGPDRPLCLVHARTPGQAEAASAEVRAAITIGDEPPDAAPVILERIAG